MSSYQYAPIRKKHIIASSTMQSTSSIITSYPVLSLIAIMALPIVPCAR